MSDEWNRESGYGPEGKPEQRLENENGTERDTVIEEVSKGASEETEKNAESGEVNFTVADSTEGEQKNTGEGYSDVSEEAAAAKEPGERPTAENPVYARSYRNSGDKEEWYAKEQKENYGSYRFTSPVPPEKPKKEQRKKKEKTSGGLGKKLGTAAATAAVFGLVAGVVFQATNYVGEKINPRQEVEIQSTDTVDEIPETSEKETVTAGSTASSSAGSNTVAQVAQNAMPSIVSIVGVSVQEIPQIYQYFGYGQEQETQSSGSGIIVGQNDEELLIATNNHVVSGADSLTVCFTNQDGTAVTSSQGVENTSAGGEEDEDTSGSAVSAQIKGTDADNDLAVISVKIEDIPEDILNEIKVAVIGDSDSLHMGDQVIAIGNALGYGQSLTSGYVSALNRQVSSDNANSTFIQTDAAINPGNSGGALLNMNGELVGINSAKIASNEVEGVGFAIPISRAEPILDELMSKETRYKVEDEDKAAYLGITCLDVTSEANQMYGMPLGVYVDSLTENGPAELAGIRKGDVIVKVDGTSVSTKEELVSRLEYYEAGEEIEFVISRSQNGEYKEETVTVTLGAKKDAPQTDNTKKRNR